ncbi:hypothetical protein D3C87_1597470 [compost metagenome]
MVFHDQLLVDPWVFTIHSFHEAQRTHFHQVLVAYLVFCKQQLVEPDVLFVLCKLPHVPVLHHIKLATDDRLNALLVPLGDKLEDPEHIAVVGDGDGGHIVLLGLFEKLFDIGGTVEQRELCVTVQM